MEDLKKSGSEVGAPAPREPTPLRVVTEIVALLVAGVLWTVLTGASLTFDATPVPGDGTVFGELAGVVAAAIGWRIVTLVRRLRKTIGR